VAAGSRVVLEQGALNDGPGRYIGQFLSKKIGSFFPLIIFEMFGHFLTLATGTFQTGKELKNEPCPHKLLPAHKNDGLNI